MEEKVVKQFNECREHWNVSIIEYKDGSEWITKVKLRYPNSNWQYWIDILFDGNNLFYTGDLGSYCFGYDIKRESFRFFSGDEINPGYWKQKLWNKDGVEEFNLDYFKKELDGYIKEYVMKNENATEEELQGYLKEAVCSSLYESVLDNSYENDKVDYPGVRYLMKELGYDDSVYINGLQFTFRYLFCCYVIQWVSNMLLEGNCEDNKSC